MSIMQKTKISLVIFSLSTVLLAIFLIYPLVKNIQKEAGDFIFQKNTFAEFETKIQNLEEFQTTYQNYQPNLEKIDTLFIDPKEPVNFIEFLENEAAIAKLSIDISPLSSQAVKGEIWPSMNFQLILTGSFSGFSKFLEKLESSPYLIEVVNFDTRRASASKEDVATTLLLKVYTK